MSSAIPELDKRAKNKDVDWCNILKTDTLHVLEESLVPYAISHQTGTTNPVENYYRWPARFSAFTMLHEESKRIRGKGSDHDDFPGCFFNFESHLTEIRVPRKETESYKAFIRAVSLLTESQDPYTAGHQKKVSELAGCIAQEMGLPSDMIEGIRVAGIVHDMGKMSVPAAVVTKPGALTPFEFSIIKEHPQKAYSILMEIEFPWPIAEIVLQHHERLNGSGYPRGLKGDKIRLEARVLAVADVVGAISSHRPYRRDLGMEAALEEIHKNNGVLYDAEVTRACQRSFKGNESLRGSLLTVDRIQIERNPGEHRNVIHTTI